MEKIAKNKMIPTYIKTSYIIKTLFIYQNNADQSDLQLLLSLLKILYNNIIFRKSFSR
jgi:hypothetical protein